MPTRRAAVLLALALLLPGLAAPTAARAAGPRFDASERALLRQVNRVRAHHGLARLRADRRLARVADLHSRDMLRSGFFAHPSSDGSSFEQRVRRHVRARTIGENLALVNGVASPAQIVRMWLDSAHHREILLAPGFRLLGVGQRAGDHGGREAVLVTADFASRR
jgi:uncharacterized protein YkwD